MQKREIQALLPIFEDARDFAIRRVTKRGRYRSTAEIEGFPTVPAPSLNSSNCESYGIAPEIQALLELDEEQIPRLSRF